MMVRASPTLTKFIVAALAAILSLFSPTSINAEPPAQLRYSGREGRTVGYRIEITADRDDATETLEGVVDYKFNTVTESVLQVTYSGGLTKTSKPKSTGSFSRFGPSRFGRAFGPFSSTPFQGLTTTTNQLTLNPLGEIQSMEGDSQLPYLLGNASLLIFEALPEQPKQTWTVTAGISITEEGGRRDTPYFPRFPFEREEPTRTTAGSEILTYHMREVDGAKVVIDKTYRLESPAPTEHVSGFEINGTGTWTFNRELGLPESLDFKQRLKVRKGNTTIVIPMTIKYTRMSDDEKTKYEEDKQKRLEEAQRQLAERRKQEANTPLTEQEIRVILQDLKSDNTSVVLSALQKLQGKNPEKSDPRIAVAVDALRSHENVFVKQNVEQVAAKWPLPDDVLSEAARKRTWSDRSGRFAVDAEFVALEGDTVRLRSSDGQELVISFDRLSEADREVVRELTEPQEPIDNPFD